MPQVEGTRGEEMVLPSRGVKRKAKLNDTVVVAFTPNKSGESGFACGRGILQGKIVMNSFDQ
jgi:plastocyanin domain-containing protein